MLSHSTKAFLRKPCFGAVPVISITSNFGCRGPLPRNGRLRRRRGAEEAAPRGGQASRSSLRDSCDVVFCCCFLQRHTHFERLQKSGLRKTVWFIWTGLFYVEEPSFGWAEREAKRKATTCVLFGVFCEKTCPFLRAVDGVLRVSWFPGVGGFPR